MCIQATQLLALVSSIVFDKIQIQHNMQKVYPLSVHFRYTIMYLAHGTNAWCEMIDVCKT